MKVNKPFLYSKLESISSLLYTMSGTSHRHQHHHQHGRGRDCQGIEKQLSGDDPDGPYDVKREVYEDVCINMAVNIGALIPILVIFFVAKRRAWETRKGDNKPTFSNWLLAQFSIADLDKIGKQCGIDVVNFFLFQQYLIYFAFMQLFVCITLVLPLNLSGNYSLTFFIFLQFS